ncbi:chorismate-binding protein [Candidatus Binatia bacterium]|nr:chorismate-binding protein [Candidatus Binatia bacterium]
MHTFAPLRAIPNRMSVLELDISTSPETVFRANGGGSGAFWFDGPADGGATFMGFTSSTQLLVRADGSTEIHDHRGARTSRGDALRAIETFVAEGRTLDARGTAPHTVGYLAYDLVALLEPRVRPRRDPSATLPLAWLARHDAVVEMAHVARRTGARRVRIHAVDAAAAERCATLVRRFGVATQTPDAPARSQIFEQPDETRHVRAVQRALAYVAAGDVYQVNLAQRFRVRSDLPPRDAFLRLRAAQPVPFAAYLDCGVFSVLCGSPERFLRVDGERIDTEPIKGTRPRGDDAARDRELRAALCADAKERAEHVMVVDLERNDLGRVCTAGSIHVPSLMRIESFATLHHMVSTVRGTLRPEVGLVDVLRAAFPGGSITGAPKIRAAQVIAELEDAPREIYTGALFRFRGPRDFDSAIAIRTAVARDGVYTYHAGGGIVADSDPVREHRECLLKAQPFLRALDVADAALPRVSA